MAEQISPETKVRIAEYIKQGWSERSIANELGVSRSSVSKYRPDRSKLDRKYPETYEEYLDKYAEDVHPHTAIYTLYKIYGMRLSFAGDIYRAWRKMYLGSDMFGKGEEGDILTAEQD